MHILIIIVLICYNIKQITYLSNDQSFNKVELALATSGRP